MTPSTKLTLILWLIIVAAFYGLLWLQKAHNWQAEAEDHFHKLVASIRSK